MDFFNELFDLSAVAGGAGLLGGGAGSAVALMFAGTIVKMIIRVVLTALLTGVAYYFLLGALGFEIVPKADVTQQRSTEFSDTFSPQGSIAVVPEDSDERAIIVRSPFRS